MIYQISYLLAISPITIGGNWNAQRKPTLKIHHTVMAVISVKVGFMKATWTTKLVGINVNCGLKYKALVCIQSENCSIMLIPEFLTCVLSLFHQFSTINQVPISWTDLSLFWGLNLIQSDSWLSLSLFVKSAPGFYLSKRARL